MSLFENMPQNRSCSDALIPSGYCACNEPVELSIHEFRNETAKSYRDLSKFLLSDLNDTIRAVQDQCEAFLRVERITSIKKSLYANVYYYMVS